MLKNYKELKVWQRSYQLCLDIYKITKGFPKKRYGLTSQIRRAALSVPCNIAEGYGRKTTPEYIHSLTPFWQRNWRRTKFFNWQIGMGLKNEKGYIKTGITRPFSVSTKNDVKPRGRYGFSAEGGIKLKAFLIGLFYKYAGFEGPDVKMIQSGLFIGYSWYNPHL